MSKLIPCLILLLISLAVCEDENINDSEETSCYEEDAKEDDCKSKKSDVEGMECCLVKAKYKDLEMGHCYAVKKTEDSINAIIDELKKEQDGVKVNVICNANFLSPLSYLFIAFLVYIL